MEHYGGVYRQSGHGLGSIFSVLGRMAVPFLKRTAVPLLKRTAVPLLKKQAKRLAPHLVRAGVGMVNDITTKKRNVKQAAQAAGAQLMLEAMNSKPRARKRQSRGGRRKVKRPRRDVFD